MSDPPKVRSFDIRYYNGNVSLAVTRDDFKGDLTGARIHAASELVADRLGDMGQTFTRAEVYEVLDNGTLALRAKIRVRVEIEVPEDARCT